MGTVQTWIGENTDNARLSSGALPEKFGAVIQDSGGTTGLEFQLATTTGEWIAGVSVEKVENVGDAFAVALPGAQIPMKATAVALSNGVEVSVSAGNRIALALSTHWVIGRTKGTTSGVDGQAIHIRTVDPYIKA